MSNPLRQVKYILVAIVVIMFTTTTLFIANIIYSCVTITDFIIIPVTIVLFGVMIIVIKYILNLEE